MISDDLDTKSLEELDRIFVAEVCDWHEGLPSDGEYPQYWYDAYGEVMALSVLNLPRFTRSADAVLPWLRKWGEWRATGVGDECEVVCNAPTPYTGTAPTFPHAAVKALIRAERAKKN